MPNIIDLDRLDQTVQRIQSKLEKLNVSYPLSVSLGGTGNAVGYIQTGRKAGSTIGDAATAEGKECTASNYESHAEGYNTTASAQRAHSEGLDTIASGADSHAEGNTTTASGKCSHAEGNQTKATADHAHAEGYITEANNTHAHAEGARTIASGDRSHAEGYYSTASGDSSHAEGHYTNAVGERAHSEGYQTTANGPHSHVEGYKTTTGELANESHTEGHTSSASAPHAHAENRACIASGTGSHAQGCYSESSGIYADANGYHCKAQGNHSHADGAYTVADAASQTVVGVVNAIYSNDDKSRVNPNAMFIVGRGDRTTDSSGNNVFTRANAFRVGFTNVWGGVYNSTGADYAEYFEWEDGNVNNDDRVGRFVTLNGEKINLATSSDLDEVIGVVSALPSVVGDSYDDQWKGMYEYDIYGRPLWEEVTVPAEIIETPNPDDPDHPIQDVISPKHTETRQKINPSYDRSKKYKSRSSRSEWDSVGLVGKLAMIDDGSCQVNRYCRPTDGGIATHSDIRTRFRVMSRLDDTHIRILIL